MYSIIRSFLLNLGKNLKTLLHKHTFSAMAMFLFVSNQYICCESYRSAIVTFDQIYTSCRPLTTSAFSS